MQREVFQRGAIGRLRIHVLPTQRFKTFSLSLFAGVPLDESRVTQIALTPFVLRRGTERYPETIAFRERLDELYGAGFGFDLYKRGDYQVVQFRLDIINDRFVSSEQSHLKEAISYLGEALTAPALEDGRFRTKYVEAEKTTVSKRIEAIINDKIRYAAERCVEEMCKGEPYRLLALGRKEELPSLSAQTLYDGYREWLDRASLDLYVSGDTSLEQVKEWAAEAFRLADGSPQGYAKAELRSARPEPQTIVERLDVGQGKLNLGLRTSQTYGEDDYPSLLVYNGILGAFPHSKLFINVREKASLAYYASSRLDGHKGLLTIQSGIEIENYEKALTIIREQLDAVRQGQFGAEELSRTQAMLANQLREVQDSAFERIGFDYNTVLSGKDRTAEDMIAAVEAVTPDQVVAAAQGVALDTIYFLRDQKGEG
ncbi:EF-P 5-aminopentanol modification-associated protein YfmF [Cohnella sp. REN36]|uniref:EF-P 5-aminopentanol modification-associated protein YfmF n=1 Tax=Cohnella sp. REN36 TaxID=2887347 RepID=UPI001D134D21|nr:pitrilysin family protein [Cohnella sp. REN36]MCC3371809.1 insulinase family protein [Cohnella sp. REN36]